MLLRALEAGPAPECQHEWHHLTPHRVPKPFTGHEPCLAHLLGGQVLVRGVLHQHASMSSSNLVHVARCIPCYARPNSGCQGMVPPKVGDKLMRMLVRVSHTARANNSGGGLSVACPPCTAGSGRSPTRVAAQPGSGLPCSGATRLNWRACAPCPAAVGLHPAPCIGTRPAPPFAAQSSGLVPRSSPATAGWGTNPHLRSEGRWVRSGMPLRRVLRCIRTTN